VQLDRGSDTMRIINSALSPKIVVMSHRPRIVRTRIYDCIFCYHIVQRRAHPVVTGARSALPSDAGFAMSNRRVLRVIPGDNRVDLAAAETAAAQFLIALGVVLDSEVIEWRTGASVPFLDERLLYASVPDQSRPTFHRRPEPLLPWCI
jgi:hypothetical protein